MAVVTVLSAAKESALYIDGELRLIKKQISFRDIAVELAEEIRFISATDDGEFPMFLGDSDFEDAA